MLDSLKFKCDVYESVAVYFVDKKTGSVLRNEHDRCITRNGIQAAILFCNEYRREHKAEIEILFDNLTSTEWYARERARFQYGAYKPLPAFITAALARFVPFTYDSHFLHFSADGKNVAYTPDHKSGVLDRQVRTTFERYLTKYYSEYLKPHEIRDFAAAMHKNEFTVEFGETREDFRFAFENQDVKSPSSGYRSCMSYPKNDGHYVRNLPCHPAEVYAAGDLQVAFIRNPVNAAQIFARTLIYKGKQAHTRIYATSEETRAILKKILEEMGYHFDDDLTGVDLLKVHYSGDKYVIPYVDGDGDKLKDNGEFFTLSDDSDGCVGKADRTDGVATIDEEEEEPEFEYYCERCETGMNDGDGFSVVTSRHRGHNQTACWCDSCTDCHAFRCEGTNEYYSSREFSPITVLVRSGRRFIHETFCEEACEDSFFHCANNDEYYCSETCTMIEVETSSGTETWCEEASEDEFFKCENTGNLYSKDDFTAIEVHVEIGNQEADGQIWCKEETDGEWFFCEACHEYYADTFTEIEVLQLDGTFQMWCAEDTTGMRFFCEYMNTEISRDFLHAARLAEIRLLDMAIL